MRYEHRIYVVQKTRIKDAYTGGMTLGDKWAMFNTEETPELIEKISAYKPTNTYFYSDDGYTKVIEDCYGDPLIEIPLDDMIEILRDLFRDNIYSRYKPVLSYLETLQACKWANIVVLYYGY